MPKYSDSEPAGGLTIGELSARTRVSVATLRSWEARHGFPQPARAPSGHRRYAESDVELVASVIAQRRAGLSLDAAVERARASVQRRQPSIFAALRRAQPQLVAHQLPKRAMVALSRAVEDEWLARAEGGLVVGFFQHERFYRQSERRWRELARDAEVAAVFAAFAGRRARRSPEEVALAPGSPMQREWAIVCAGRSSAVCLVGWERPHPAVRPDGLRTFEAAWTCEPSAVVQAVGAAAAAACEPSTVKVAEGLRSWLHRWSLPPARLSETESLANRIAAYVVASARWT